MMRESDILNAFRNGTVELPPLVIELAEVEPRLEVKGRVLRPDAYIDVRWEGRVFRFVAEFKAQATPKSFREAIEQAHSYAKATELRPLVVSPYFAPERLKELEVQCVSGVDLCGNGVVMVPGELLVVRTGNPNRFPASRKISNVYQGTSSLVARVFLARPCYDSVQEVMDEVTERGGRVSLGTVSKVLKNLEEDLIIRRKGRASILLQADELLDRLAAGFKPPRVDARKKYRWKGPSNELVSRLCDWNRELVLTGAASVERYSVMPREKAIQCYCTSIESIERGLGSELEESPIFPDLDLAEACDQTVFFDRRSDDTVSAASPVQCWLELQAGDKRQRDAGSGVRDWILKELQQNG